ncbi:MAG: hypothetical protein P4M07_04505 [Xanthobacteraceae bacterium]|nr:hypothetical protein [Xanthobacteraceae bacterium]
MISGKAVLVAMTLAIVFPPAVQAEDKHSCEPWPNCQLDHLNIKPGAPNVGIRPQAMPPDGGTGAASSNVDRDTLRIPKTSTDGIGGAVK